MSRKNTPTILRAKTTITTGGCWEWQGCKTRSGYGRTMYGGRGATTHRLMYMLQVGDIPEGKLVMHTCDNPPCINPAHLRLGTHVDNMDDMTTKGRRARLPGELNPAAKLKRDEAEQIRSLAAGGMFAKNIAPLFGVSMATVYAIKNGRIWNNDKLKEAGI